MKSSFYINASYRHEIYLAALDIFDDEVNNKFHPCLCEVLKKAAIQLDAEHLVQIPDDKLIEYFDELICHKPENCQMLWFPLEETEKRRKLLHRAIIESNHKHIMEKKIVMT